MVVIGWKAVAKYCLSIFLNEYHICILCNTSLAVERVDCVYNDILIDTIQQFLINSNVRKAGSFIHLHCMSRTLPDAAI